MNNNATITLSQKAFSENISVINKRTGHSGLALVLKSNAYGHGVELVAHLAQRNPGVSWLCTAGVKEALALRGCGIEKPLLVLSFLDGAIEQAVIQKIHFVAYSYQAAQRISLAAQQVGCIAHVHIKIDSGMGRLGILPDEAVELTRRIQRLPGISVSGLFTHLSDTAGKDHTHTIQQMKQFDAIVDSLEAVGIRIPFIHVQPSSSLNYTPKRNYSFVRVGGSAYGLWKSEEHRQRLLTENILVGLQPIIELKAPLIQIKKVSSGSSIGYGQSFITRRPTVLGIIPVGYYDGLQSSLGNKGMGLINGYYAPFIGRVSMNLTIVDLTDVTHPTVGDDVLLLGNAPCITPWEVAQQSGKLTNEITTHLHPSIKRSVVPHHESLLLHKKHEKFLRQKI